MLVHEGQLYKEESANQITNLRLGNSVNLG